MTDSSVGRILGWLKAGYPQGIPAHDLPTVLMVLRRNLSDADIEAIADELALRSMGNGSAPVSADAIRSMVRDHALQSASEDDVRRVSAVLAEGGWPLAQELA